MNEYNKNKTLDVINDPLGQTHSLTNIIFCCFVWLDLKSGDVRTDNMCKNNDHYRP